MRQANVLKKWIGFPLASILFVILFTSCLFSPTKSGDDFTLSSRVWDGVILDSAGRTQSLEGWLRLHFDPEGEVQVQVGLRKGQAPFAVRSSGRMSLGFEDEPLTLNQGELIFSPATEALVADFLSKVDRYKQEKDKLYLRTSAYPDIMITLKASDTSVAIAVKPDTAKPDTAKPVIPEEPDTISTPPTPDQKELLAKLQATTWNGLLLDSSRGYDADLRGMFELSFYKDGRFFIQMSCAIVTGNYILQSGTVTIPHGIRMDPKFESRPCLEEVANQTVNVEAVIQKILSKPLLPTLPRSDLILRTHPALSSIPPMGLWLTAGSVNQPIDTIPIPPIPPIPDPQALTLPLDFPTYGGRLVPNERAELFAQTVEAWNIWKVFVSTVALTGYVFDFEETCFCLANRNGRVTVKNGAPSDFVHASGIWVSNLDYEDLPTVEKLFAQIGLLLTRSYREGESLTLGFGRFGEPTFLKADPIPGQTQDDMTFEVKHLAPNKPSIVFPTLTLEQLVRFGWVLHSLQDNEVLSEIIRKVSVQFGTDGTWTGTFGCNSYGGTMRQLADGRYAFTLDYQTFFECGDGAVTELLEALLKDPVIVQRAGERMLSIQSVDGIIKALFGADQ